MVERVVATKGALALLARLREKHGPLVLHQSEGWREGASPACVPRARFTAGISDRLLGEIGDCPIYVSRSHEAYWRYAQLIIDAAEDGGEAAGGIFRARSRRFDTEEWATLGG